MRSFVAAMVAGVGLVLSGCDDVSLDPNAAVARRISRARQVVVKTDLQVIYISVKGYHNDTGSWPESIDQLVNPKHPTTGEPISLYLAERPKDPWGHDYVYELTETGPIIRCLGRDNKPGGEGEDEDYVWPEPEENGRE